MDEMQYKEIAIFKNKDWFSTKGLVSFINKELKVRIEAGDLDDYIKVLKYLIDYITTTQPVITAGQTISYQSWILKFVYGDDDSYILFEAASDGVSFVSGVENAIKVIAAQERQCNKYNVSCVFPTFDQKIVISKGVYEGLPVQAVRYPSPQHMSGWWITTDLYENNINSLLAVHYYHVAFKRPDVLKYLALPFGYRLSLDGSEVDVWYDNEILI